MKIVDRIQTTLQLFAICILVMLGRAFPLDDYGRMDQDVRVMSRYFSDSENYQGKAYSGKEARATIDEIRDAVKAYYWDHPNATKTLRPYEAFQILMLKAHHESHFMHWPDNRSDTGRRAKADDAARLYYYGPYHHSKKLWATNFARYAPNYGFWQIWLPRNTAKNAKIELAETSKGLNAKFADQESKNAVHQMRASTFYTSYVNLGYMLEEVIPELQNHFASKGHADIRIGAMSLYLEHVVGIGDAKRAIQATLSDANRYNPNALRIAASTIRSNKPLFTNNGRSVAADQVFYQIWTAMESYERLRQDVYGQASYIPFFQRPQDRPNFLGRIARYIDKRIVGDLIALEDIIALAENPRFKPHRSEQG